jgi:Zn-dependent M16 (insulinase) family peptidase
MQASTQQPHPAFTHIRTQPIESLNVVVEEYQHKKTGAQHVHIQADNPENVFLVALRTVPSDSTGVAHILEHTALCGSKRYPVRDPFFMMTRRSLNTFMNAMTSSDWTAYPFASVNRKDFDNLLDVYLDAVFFSRLDPMDFAQEGHRVEFAEPDNSESPLVYKGVVYNEMKGAMSSVPAQLHQALSKYLFPTTTYHHNSGGDPDAIPDLTYQQLVDFYRSHYHPSNAIFMTFGDIPAGEHQAKFEDLALKEFDRLDKQISVPTEKRYHAPLTVQEYYAVSDEADISDKHHVVLGWLLGDNTQLMDAMRAQLLASVLLDNSASPLMRALETTDLGAAPSPLCGIDDSQRELTFMCGLQGCTESNVAAIEKLILETLEKVAEEGIPLEDMEASLHQLELHQREIGGDSYPYGLQLVMTALTAATHRGDPVALLNIDPVLKQLREDIQDPDFIKQLVRKLLLDNMHRVRLTLSPDTGLAARREQAEAEKLAQIKAALKPEEKEQIIARAQALQDRQNQVDDESILPKVTLEDVPLEEKYVYGEKDQVADSTLTRYDAGTNGLVYQQVVFELPELPDDLLQLLPIYTTCLAEVGIGDKDYLEVQRWQARVCGSLGAYSSVRGGADDIQQISSYVTLSGKALNRNQGQLCELMEATITGARFDELARLREMVAQMRSQREQSITGSGHALAMLAASSGMCGATRLTHELSGAAGITKLKALDKSLADSAELTRLGEKLAQLHKLITQAPRQYLLVSEGEHHDQFRNNYTARFSDIQNPADFQPFSLQPVHEQVGQAWLTNSQVNFCAKAFPTVPLAHEDAAPLVVLANFLRNGYLHRVIREQGGAYGGGANQDNNSAAFRFFSYRDPRLGETLDDFDQAIDWLLNTEHGWQPVEEAILGTISGIDRPESPAGEAKRTFQSELHGRTRELKQAFRERVLATRAEDLKRVAEKYLTKRDAASTAVITDRSKQAAAEELGLKGLAL